MDRKRKSSEYSGGVWIFKKSRKAMYLENNTPLRTIEVRNVPVDMTIEVCKAFVTGHFERDGPVDHVEIADKFEEGKMVRVAYVTFVMPEDAAEILDNVDVPGHFRTSMFVIRAADNQPKIDSNARNLEQINDHCLLNVMSKLQLLDVVNLSRTSIRMRSVCDIYFKKFAHFSYRTSTGDDSSITDRNLPIILEQIGRHITSIEWVKLNDEEFELLARFCPNVTKITLSSMKNVNTTLLNQNKQFFGKLTQLCVKASGQLSDRGIRAMTSGGKVRTIDIQDCSRTLGKFVLLLHRNKLKSFTFLHGRQRVPYDKCFAIDTWKAKLVKFCCDVPGSISLLSSKSKSLEHLKELHLDFSTLSHDLQTLNFSDLKNIQEVTLTRSNASNHYNTWFRTTPVNANDLINAFSQCPTLQSLSIHMIIIDDATIGALTRLQNLKQLKLTRVDNTIGQSLYKLALALPRLQKVAISFDDPSTEFTNGHLISKFVASMPMLTEFYHELVRFSWLDKIIVARGNNDPPILRVGLPKHMMYDVRKGIFEATSNGSILLSAYTEM